MAPRIGGEEESTLNANGSMWWLSKPKTAGEEEYANGREVAKNVLRVATELETANIPRRWRNYVYYRYFNDEPYSAQFCYGMARRPAGFLGYYGDFEFEPARYNLIGTCADVYVNRLLSHKSFITFSPEHGNFTQRQTSIELEEWVEGGFEEIHYWRERLAMGIAALCYGSGYLIPSEGLDGNIRIEQVDPNEMLFPNYDDPNPSWCMRRVWMNREDCMDRYGKKNPEIAKAIRNAQSAFPAFWFGPGNLDCNDIIPLVSAWRAKHVDGSPGRYVLVVGDVAIEDEPVDESDLSDLIIRFDFHQKPSACIGQGIPALILSINQAIDDYLDVIQESDRRAGTGKWLYTDASGVNPDDLGDTVAAAVQYTAGTGEPKYIAPEPIGEYAIQRVNMFIELGMKRVHISELAIQGEQPRALTSAVALERWSQIDDMNFLELIGRLEDVDRKVALALIRLGKKLKPSFTAPGRERQIIDWDSLELGEAGPKGIRAYNTGRFGQSISAKLQELSSLLAQGSITRDQYNKYLQVPDRGDLLDRINAPMEGADRQIEAMLKPKADYIPPTPFLNLDYAKQAVEAVYILEENRGTPAKKLDLLLMYRAAVIELIEQRDTPDQPASGNSVPAIPNFGGTAAANPALAPPKNPLAPADTGPLPA